MIQNGTFRIVPRINDLMAGKRDDYFGTLIMQFPITFPTPFPDSPVIHLSVTGVEMPSLPPGSRANTFDYEYLYVVEPLEITPHGFSLAYTIHNTGNLATPGALTVSWLALFFPAQVETHSLPSNATHKP